jgi:cytochrome c-type biogenesis protein CcmH/NrfG
MPKATRVDDRRTKAGRRHANGYPQYSRPESWKDLAQAAYKKQLEPLARENAENLSLEGAAGESRIPSEQEKGAPKDALSKLTTTSPGSRLTER